MWGSDQPDNYNNEDCGQMVVSRKGGWNDGLCNDKRKYICEVKGTDCAILKVSTV